MQGDERAQFESLETAELAQACNGTLHPTAEDGIRLFDAKEYWHAHEALEEAWLEEKGPARQLYKGILQAGVAYLHIQRGNFVGAMKLHKRSQVWLAPWPDLCRTVDVRQLKADLETVIAEVRRLGVEHIDEFDQSLLKPIQRVSINS
ncbi:MAG: DUF309 domain-containing protein [Chloroflexi bacterium]|nr:DUF309 domain-containing protein [Chloroflexota bacterium]